MSNDKNIDNCKCYLTHWNYSRPFSVYIDNSKNEVHVFENKYHDDDSYEKIFVATFHPQKVFIGESTLNKMTRFSGGHGPDFDGNSILLKMDVCNYIFIGYKIFSFKSKHDIITFMSHIGNNDIPYPYAIDIKNNYYFLLTDGNDGILKMRVNKNPYDKYYKIIRGMSESENIEYIYMSDEIFQITAHSHPAKEYERLVERFGEPIYIKIKGEERKIISKPEYIELLENYNKKVRLEPLCDLKVIEKKVNFC